MWLSERIARSFSTVKKGTIQGNYPRVIEGTLYAGPVAITATTAANNAGGQMLGFGPFYAISSFDDSEFKVLPDSTWITKDNFTAQFAAQSLPGLDIPAASAVAASHNAWVWFNSSFTVSATDSTRFSPFGVEDNRLFGIGLVTDDVEYFYVSPLGVFQEPTYEEFQAIARPGGGVWYLRETHNRNRWHTLVDAETGLSIAPSRHASGGRHPLALLPPAGFHQLRPRNEKVSAKMRSCTLEQAAQLINDPLSILDFAEQDKVLAAAIAGMIADIREISHSNCALPFYDSVPDFLTHLYDD